MENNDIKNSNSTRTQNINEGFNEYLKEKNIKAYYQFDRFEFMAPSKDGFGLEETNVLVVEKEIEVKDGKKIPIFEFYQDGNLIAQTNEKGEILLSDQYKKNLKSRFKRLLQCFKSR